MLEHNFTRIFEKSTRLDVFRIYHRARQNTVFERRFDAPIPNAHMHNLPRTNSFKLSSRAIHTISDCLLPIDNHECLILCSSNDSINSSHYCSYAFVYSTKQGSLLNQITLHVATCAVELINDFVWLNLVIFISLCALFLLMISSPRHLIFLKKS